MSDPVVHYNDSAGKMEKSMQSYHFAWMSHWTKKSCDASSSSLEKKEYDGNGSKGYQSKTNVETLSNTYGLFKGTGKKKMEIRASEVGNESLRMTSTAIINENLEVRGFPADTANQMRPQIDHDPDFEEQTPSIRKMFLPSLLPVDSEANNTTSGDCHFEHDVSQNANEPVKTLALFRDSDFAISRPWQVDFTASTSDVKQHGFKHGDDRPSSLPAYVDRSASTSKEQLQHRNLRFLEHEYKRRSEVSVCQEKIQSQLKTELPEDSCLQPDKELFRHFNPSTKNNQSLAFGGEKLQNIQNFAGFRPPRSQSKFAAATKAEDLHCSDSSIPKLLHSVHDMGTMRICTTVDSVVGVHAGHPKFSQTTHSFFITKKTDINLNKENRTFRNKRDSNIQDLSPPSGHGNKGELQPEHGLKEAAFGGNGENDNASSSLRKAETSLRDVKALCSYKEDKGKNVEDDMVLDTNLKNESSAETGIMEVDEFEEKNQFSGVNSSPSDKIIRISASSRLILGSKGDTGYEQCSSELPGMNFELPALPASGRMFDKKEQSTSRTESLDMETLLANAVHSEPEHFIGSSSKTEPNNAWVKRLKLSASNSFIGTKNSSLSPCNKKNNLALERNQKSSMINSGLTLDGYHGKELMVLDKTVAMPKQDESFFAGSSKGRDSLLSESWIQRWRHGEATSTKEKLEPAVFCEPKSSNVELEDIQKNQVPSIAAMALMGKAMRVFQPCQFQKKGSIVAWY